MAIRLDNDMNELIPLLYDDQNMYLLVALFSARKKTVMPFMRSIFGKRNSAKNVGELKVPKPGAFIQ